MKSFFGLLGSLLSVVWVLFVFATPLLAVWLASSLVAFNGGPRELAVAAGVLLCPVLPGLWELRVTRRWNRSVAAKKQLGRTPRRTFSMLNRLVLRTLFINGLFVGALLVWFPKTAFSALATRGDWFLADRQDDTSRIVRGAVFATAGGLEWLHELANPNPYKKKGDDAPVPQSVKPSEEVKWNRGQGDWKKPLVEPSQPAAPLEPAWSVGATTWPRPNDVDPGVAAMTPGDESSIEAVGRAIAAGHPDPFDRVKALHDWVVTRLDYDEQSLEPGSRKPQDAEAVFKARAGVCEGYARLMVALGKVTGDPITYLVGDVREESGEAASIGHAWNAVEIKGQWYLLDTTWDDPVMRNHAEHVYRTDYLFIPPSIAIFDHFPDDDRWQLLSKPLTRGDFLRQPFARPGLAREGLVLLAPERSTVEVRDSLELKISNPRRLHVSVELAARDSTGPSQPCGVDDAAEVALRCAVGAPGRYQARIFTNRERYGTYGQVASIDVVRR